MDFHHLSQRRDMRWERILVDRNYYGGHEFYGPAGDVKYVAPAY